MVRTVVSPGLVGNLLRLEATGKVSCGLGLGASAFFPPSQFDFFVLIMHLQSWGNQLFFSCIHAIIHRSLFPDQPSYRGSFGTSVGFEYRFQWSKLPKYGRKRMSQ
jgi:hypothetical protein